jgi:hypothetical protein
MPVGARDAQLAHAVGQSVDGPHPDDTYVVVLAARDELHLALEADRLERLGVRLSRVREIDGPYAGQLTALGLKPGWKEVIGRHVSSLPLLRP